MFYGQGLHGCTKRLSPQKANISMSGGIANGQVYNADHADFADITSVVLRVRVLGFQMGQNLNRGPKVREYKIPFLP